MKKSILFLLFILLISTSCASNSNNTDNEKINNDSNDSIEIKKTKPDKTNNTITIESVYIESDKDSDGLTDLLDIVEGARIDARNKPTYKSKYYTGGYPPDNEGVCTDVIWRAYKNAGYSIKDMIDNDIKNNTDQYPRVDIPDPNIDFRRVVNLHIFFEKVGQKLTAEIIPDNVENLYQWQGGDIVIFSNPEHIGIISSKRRDDGVPYMIHNAGPHTMEADHLLLWEDKIIGHYRFPAE